MKTKLLLLGFPILCLTSCFQGDDATNADNTNNAGGTGSPYLAREVVGVWMLSTDQRFGYDEPCNVLDEGLVQEMFDVKPTEKLVTLDYPNGCQFKWPEGTVSVAFGGPKPYPSIYHAEYIFDKMYQGKTGQVSGQMGETSEKPALSGPEPEGTSAERPDIEPKGGAQADPDDDASSPNDSSNSVSGVTPAASQFAKPVISTGRFVAVSGVGDKAVWEPAKNMIHVLYNNHIISVGVQTKGTAAQKQEKASSLAEIVLDYFNEKSST